MRIIAALFASALSCLAAGNVATSVQQLGTTDTWSIAWRWTADASDGSVPATIGAINAAIQGYYFTTATVSPGSVNPTAGYSVTLTDSNGVDILNAQAASSSATAAQTYQIPISSPPSNGAVTLHVTGNSVHSATGSVVIYLNKASSIAFRGGNASIAANLPLFLKPNIKYPSPSAAIIIEPTITDPSVNSINFPLYIEQTNPSKLTSNDFLNGLGVNMVSGNAQPNQNAGVISFWDSRGGADPFGADLHGIIGASATAAPHYAIGVQGTSQQDSAAFPASVYSAAVIGDCESLAMPAVPCTSNFRATGNAANFILLNDPSVMTREGIVLTPADDLNPTIRAFGIVNHANTANNFYATKSGTGFFRGGIEAPAGINYATETGGSANNAIVASLTVVADMFALSNGMCIVLALGHSLQAGANTLNLNGLGALAIQSHRNVTANIGTGYTIAGASAPYVSLCYNGAVWLDMSQ